MGPRTGLDQLRHVAGPARGDHTVDDGEAAVAVEVVEHHAGVERVAARGREQRAQPRPGGRPEARPDQAPQPRRVQPDDLDRADVGPGGQRVERLADRQGAACRSTARGRSRVTPANSPQQGERVGVGVVHVVGAQRQRPVRAQPLDGLQRQVGGVRPRRISRLHPEQGRHQPVRPAAAHLVGGDPVRPHAPLGQRRGET